ncbi:MAG: Uncharacterized protein G01um101416_199 [Microgenomates group bacterium Gr01-1014_16]|nr:MAG: Uncharacterized protein G01um101416_199 [Microgenomates group bacterium Gr01-1014_16]
MKKFLSSLIILFLVSVTVTVPAEAAGEGRAVWWQFQSIDTMKYSRDIAREKLKDSSFDTSIDLQVKNIAATGATHVAIATPYDEEFIPFLTRWVNAARKHKLNIWFRGNFSGWENWFDYPEISREEHLAKTKTFITKNAGLFQNGDVFTACPECENGGPGDPRQTGDVEGHRQFLIDEFVTTQQLFRNMGKNVRSNYFSMNGDMAKAIMDKETTTALGGIVTIDHYVASPQKLVKDIQNLAHQSGGKIILGEFGAPIPDIHGSMSQDQQAKWLNDAFKLLVSTPELVGINYWTNVGGSTQLWTENYEPKKAVDVVTFYFFPKTARGIVNDVFGSTIKNAQVSSSHKTVYANSAGNFQLPYIDSSDPLSVSAKNYISKEYNNYSSDKNIEVYLSPIRKGILFRLKLLTYRLLGRKIHG